MGLLIKVWLLISGLYCRAKMYEDSQGAIEEASSLVEELEPEGREQSDSSHSATSLNSAFDQTLSGGNGVDVLRADIWTQVSDLGSTSLFADALAAWLSCSGTRLSRGRPRTL